MMIFYPTSQPRRNTNGPMTYAEKLKAVGAGGNKGYGSSAVALALPGKPYLYAQQTPSWALAQSAMKPVASLAPGDTVVDPSTGKVVYNAPQASTAKPAYSAAQGSPQTWNASTATQNYNAAYAAKVAAEAVDGPPTATPTTDFAFTQQVVTAPTPVYQPDGSFTLAPALAPIVPPAAAPAATSSAPLLLGLAAALFLAFK